MGAVNRVRTRLRAVGSEDRGMVTVEAAIAMASLAVILLLALGAVMAVAVHVQCLDAAREAARLTARGEEARAVTIAQQVAPSGASVQISTAGDVVTAVVSGRSRLLPGLDLSGRAVAVLEPTAAGGEPAGGNSAP